MTETETGKLVIEATLPDFAIGYVAAPFGNASGTIYRHKGEIISSSELAYGRMNSNAPESLSGVGSYTCESVIYYPGKGALLVLNSPLLNFERAIRSTRAHRGGHEFHLSDHLATWYQEQAEEDAKKVPNLRKVLRLEGDLNFNTPISTLSFADEELTLFLFSRDKVSGAYDTGQFLHSCGVKEMPIWLVPRERVDRETRPFVRQLWNSRIGGIYRFYLGGNGDLDHGGRVRARFDRSKQDD